MFREFHYLNKDIHEAADCYIASFHGRAVAFIATVFNPRKYRQVSRLVVLPDYQGIGIGKRLLNWLAERYHQQDRPPLFIITSNPQLRNLAKEGWLLVRAGRASRYGKWSINRGFRKNTQSRRRLTMSWKYIGKRATSQA